MIESEQKADSAEDASPDAAAARDRHVLLVEDEELVAMTMAEELRGRGWTVVGPATSLEQAQALVGTGVPLDAAILDVNLRGRWVHTLAEELDRRGVPFIVCTAYEMVDPEGRFAGAPLIAKPISPHRLGATLDALVGPEIAAASPLKGD